MTDSEGNRTVVASDESKLTTDGPIVANSEYDGETYDARLEMPGWSRNGYDDSSWRDARSVAAPEGRLTAQANRISGLWIRSSRFRSPR
ncbi:MAG: alpha-L-rhamnosidase N-terminal domain-containing protein [Alistipes sp.]